MEPFGGRLRPVSRDLNRSAFPPGNHLNKDHPFYDMKMFLNDLRESNDFLNLLLENINSAVLVADENLIIHQFNDVFTNLFGRDAGDMTASSFGTISGCVHAVLEKKECGKTSRCSKCTVRKSLLQTLVKKVPADHIWMKRTFYIDNLPTEKYLEFSTRYISFQGRRMALVIIYDITKIEKQKAELEAKQKQLDLDLRAAAGIQQSLLPSVLPDAEGLGFAWKFEPCGQIGGDIFNITTLDDGRVCLYMLDVCGHGVAAALVSVSVSQFLANIGKLTEKRLTPSVILDELNRAFPFERFDSFFSIILMMIDPVQRTLSYGSAGHPSPVLVRAGGALETLDCRGPVVGLDPCLKFSSETVQLAPGDRVVVYTDGVLDVDNGSGELFGGDRFLEAIEGSRNGGAEAMVESIHEAARRFGGARAPDDDISLLVVDLGG